MRLHNFTLPIDNLSRGGGGSLLIERALKKQDGVTRVYVNPLTEMAYIEFDSERASIELISNLIEQLGFETGRPVRVGQ